MTNFIQSVLNGNSSHDDIDKWVEAWHEMFSKDATGFIPLREHLGITEYEYDVWTVDPDYLSDIITYRRLDNDNQP